MKVFKNAYLLLFCVLPIVSFSQEVYPTEYEIQYEVKYSLDSLNLENKTIEVFYLYTSKDYGVFMNNNTAHKEKIQAYNNERIQSGNRRTSTKNISRETNYKRTFYKNRERNKVKVVAKVLDETF